jgi:hypothetical protein
MTPRPGFDAVFDAARRAFADPANLANLADLADPVPGKEITGAIVADGVALIHVRHRGEDGA